MTSNLRLSKATPTMSYNIVGDELSSELEFGVYKRNPQYCIIKEDLTMML